MTNLTYNEKGKILVTMKRTCPSYSYRVGIKASFCGCALLMPDRRCVTQLHLKLFLHLLSDRVSKLSGCF